MDAAAPTQPQFHTHRADAAAGPPGADVDAAAGQYPEK